MTFNWVKGTWIHLLCCMQLSYHFPEPYVCMARNGHTFIIILISGPCVRQIQSDPEVIRSRRTREEKDKRNAIILLDTVTMHACTVTLEHTVMGDI